MINRILLALVLCLPVSIACAQSKPSDAAFPSVVLGNTELRPLHSDIAGREYLLYVAYPDSYKDHPERKYPVVYVTDAYWGFVKTASLGSGLWYDQIVPEYILVGIGYQGENVDYGKERMFELSPSNQDYGWTVRKNCSMGGSRKFLDAIKKEIIPYVEANTRADPSFRVLAGSSMGGLFSLYAMYEEPELFQGVIASSPAIDWDHLWLFQRESELRSKALKDDYSGSFNMPVRLFMSVGGAEWPDFVGTIQSFDDLIRTGDYKNFDYEFRIIEGERHGGNVAEAYNRGLRFVFKPQMPSLKIPD